MTVSTSRAARRTVDQIVLHSYQLAGLMGFAEGTSSTQWNEKAAFARVALDSIVDHLTTYGVFVRQVTMVEVSLTSGTYKYSMGSSVVDLVGDGAYIGADATDTEKYDGETPVEQIGRDEWQGLSSKAATGRPVKYYPHRGGSDYVVEVRLWPIPDEAGTIRFQALNSPADTFDGSATLDLREYWMQYVYFKLAADLATASSLPVERCSYLEKRSRECLDYARAFANESTMDQIVLDHRVGWSR